MRTKFSGILTLLLAFVVQIGFAQQKTISGTVTDDSGLPLPGVNVLIKNTSSGTQTDFDGNYSISANQGDVLEFSYVGFTSQEIKVGASNNISVSLKAGEALKEVIVVAYGAQEERALVGSVVSLDNEVLEKQQLTSVTSAIQGNVPGVNLITSGGQPGTNPTIRIRGVGSINASADPLIIVDGSPFNGNINAISPDQVESMNVLKDAASTALYGSRGANGVIVITTKKGSFDAPTTLTLSAVTGFSDPAVKLHNVLGAEDYMKYYWEAKRNAIMDNGADMATAGQNASNLIISELGYNPYNVATPIDANGNLVPGAKLLWDTNWENELLRKAALRKEYGMTLSGGSEKSRYFLSANYLDQEGSVKESGFERITTRLNLESKVTDWLEIGLNSSMSLSEQKFPTQSGNAYQSSIQWIYNVASIYPLYERDANGGIVRDNLGNPVYDYGSSRPVFSNENAVGSLYNYSTKYKRSNFNINGFAKVNITDYLSFKTNLSYENYLYDHFDYANSEVGYASNVNGRITQDRNITTTTNFINSLNFKKTFGDHTIGADAIFEAYEKEYDRFGAQGEGFLPDYRFLVGRTSPTDAIGYVNKERLVGYLGRLTYSYKDKYYVEGSYRRDGSTKFAKESRWGDFFSVGGGWIISEENFLKNNSTINFLKLRASYGELGNNNILDSNLNELYFPYLQAYEVGYPNGSNIGVYLGGAANPRLSWEKTALTSAALEFGLFDNRIDGTIEYYNKKSIDLIYNQPTAPSTGYEEITTNVGSLRNYGWEFSVNTLNIDSENFKWRTGLNFSLDNNEITELTQQSFINGTKRWEEGKSLYDFYMQEWAGVNPDNGNAQWNQYYHDANNNGQVDVGEGIFDLEEWKYNNPTLANQVSQTTTENYEDATKKYVDGSSLPDIIGGFSTSFEYKNFDLSALFNFSFGAKVYDNSYASLMSGLQRAGFQGSTDLENRWQQPGDITNVPRLLAAQNQSNSRSTRFLYDNDYIRLKALTLGYNLPIDAIEDIGLSKVRVYLRGDNLWTYQTHDGIDPEQSISGVTDSRSSILRTISFGINIQL
ncbi:TonB-linked SusC/RagA family outer membrane protein [Mesonia hippocampi]|uniref:TonB-linked SusC/RagA family outer membrane protein n=1 Tax=Mesonia hippocampi TaxID=1628250 RepID=A0A840EPB8_9FLAO|nr:TonB-dependent receptor [Mesonia hippocampi]MBB4118911.1 TonB-linked SusC/RagA family outer membrane protein [Mesonia hippocampi]